MAQERRDLRKVAAQNRRRTWRKRPEAASYAVRRFSLPMKPTKLELLAGLFVALGIAAVTWLTVKLGAGALMGGDTYVIEARFTNPEA